MTVNDAERIAIGKIVNELNKFRARFGRDMSAVVNDGMGCLSIHNAAHTEAYEFTWGYEDDIPGRISERGTVLR